MNKTHMKKDDIYFDKLKEKTIKKKVINGDQFVHGGENGNYIRLKFDNEIVKISKCKDNDEFIITGKQLKQLQRFWEENKELNQLDKFVTEYFKNSRKISEILSSTTRKN